MKKSVKAKLIEVRDMATEYIRVGADLYEFIDEIESNDECGFDNAEEYNKMYINSRVKYETERLGAKYPKVRKRSMSFFRRSANLQRIEPYAGSSLSAKTASAIMEILIWER